MGDDLVPQARVVHASPGRLRLKVSRDALENGAATKVERALTRVAGVSAVRTNPLSSSLVVGYDPQTVEPPALLAAIERAGVAIAAPESDQEPTVEGSRAGEAVTAFFGRADQRIARATGGAADLRTVVPLALLALAAREVLAGGLARAPWYALLWYAFDSFYKLRRTKPEK